VGLIFGFARESFSRSLVLPESEIFASGALPPPLEVSGLCLCSLRNTLDVGAEGTVQGGDVGAFCTVDQKDVVPAGTVQKSVPAVIHHSSVINPGRKVSDPMLEVGDDRCAGDDPPSPGCAASRPHEHTPGGAVPSGTVSFPEVTKRPPRYMVAEVFFPSDEGIFAWTDPQPEGNTQRIYPRIKENSQPRGRRQTKLG